MALFDQFKALIGSKPEQRSTLSNPSSWFIEWLNGGPSVAGQKVNPETALKVSTVYACVSLLSRTIASLQLGFYRKLEDGSEEITGTPEQYAVCIEPNDRMTSYTWRSTFMLHLMMRGNAYAKLKFDRTGRVSGFQILHPDFVEPYLYKGKIFYKNTNEGASETLDSGEVLHIRNFSDDGIEGKSPLTYARESVGMALAANDYAAAMYENGGGLRGIVETPIPLDQKQADFMRENFLRVMRNYKETGSIGVLDRGAKFQQIALSPKDAQFIESSNMTVREIARFFGVPLHLIGDLERATFGNIEHQSIEFVTHTIRPIVKNFEDELNRRVIRKSDRSNYFFRFNLDSLLRGDTQARAQYYSQMLNAGVMSLDEVRRLENMNPIADGLGKKHYIQVNMTTLENLQAPNNDAQQ